MQISILYEYEFLLQELGQHMMQRGVFFTEVYRTCYHIYMPDAVCVYTCSLQLYGVLNPIKLNKLHNRTVRLLNFPSQAHPGLEHVGPSPSRTQMSWPISGVFGEVQALHGSYYPKWLGFYCKPLCHWIWFSFEKILAS